MTICIAALYGASDSNQGGVVVASDRMLTAGDIEFEHDSPKMYRITDTCIALSAGSALHQVELMREVRDSVAGNRHISVVEVVNVCKERFVATRRAIAEERHLRPLGLDLARFMARQDTLPEGLALNLTQRLERQTLDLELLIAGVDSRGAHIYCVTDPGESRCFDAVGFCAIGSGERHAELTFVRSEYSPRLSLSETTFLTYQAKRDAEMAPGVGDRYTDIGYINHDGLTLYKEQVVSGLAEAYSELAQAHRAGHAQAQERIKGLFESIPDTPQ